MFGSTGWIGGMIADLLRKGGEDVHLARSRLEDRDGCARCVHLMRLM